MVYVKGMYLLYVYELITLNASFVSGLDKTHWPSSRRGGRVFPIRGIHGCATWQVRFGEKLPYIRVHIWYFALQKGPFLAPKVPYKRVLFCWKLEVSPLKNACLPTSNVKLSESQVNHTFLGTFYSLFLKFALKKGQNFGVDAPYRRLGFAISKWHTCVQKSGKETPPPLGPSSMSTQ